mmetsp:Transcript_138830/g.443196  ORF Transcript_138830/g.443196 Transcript_138830/m.443196 type:complete len:228 (-) Transcript_138830:403-1086(-)
MGRFACFVKFGTSVSKAVGVGHEPATAAPNISKMLRFSPDGRPSTLAAAASAPAWATKGSGRFNGNQLCTLQRWRLVLRASAIGLAGSSTEVLRISRRKSLGGVATASPPRSCCSASDAEAHGTAAVAESSRGLLSAAPAAQAGRDILERSRHRLCRRLPVPTSSRAPSSTCCAPSTPRAVPKPVCCKKERASAGTQEPLSSSVKPSQAHSTSAQSPVRRVKSTSTS